MERFGSFVTMQLTNIIMMLNRRIYFILLDQISLLGSPQKWHAPSAYTSYVTLCVHFSCPCAALKCFLEIMKVPPFRILSLVSSDTFFSPTHRPSPFFSSALARSFTLPKKQKPLSSSENRTKILQRSLETMSRNSTFHQLSLTAYGRAWLVPLRIPFTTISQV